jgi:hypothetical protein
VSLTTKPTNPDNYRELIYSNSDIPAERSVWESRSTILSCHFNMGAIKVQITNATGLVETWRLP